jgi:hypothetical protein
VKDFFISYNRKDRQVSEWIAWTLEEAGYTTILQAWDFRPGANFVQKMDEASRGTQRTLAVLSDHYLKHAPYSQAEWTAAFQADPTGEKGKLVLVKVDDCKPTGLLASIAYIDLFEARRSGDEATAREMLVNGVRRGRAKPATPPRFPATGERSVVTRPTFPAMRERIRKDPSLNERDKSEVNELLEINELQFRAGELLREMTGPVTPERREALKAEYARLDEKIKRALKPKTFFDQLKQVMDAYDRTKKTRQPK